MSVFVHPQGLNESDQVGDRTRIWAFAHVVDGAVVGSDCNLGDCVFVETGAVVGNKVTVKNNVSIWDRVTVEDEVFLGPSMVFTNDFVPRAAIHRSREELLPTLVRRGASIGANATIVCGNTIGEHSMVAAGAVVTRDVAAHALVAGSPARRMGWVCACGGRLDAALSCPECGQAHELVDEDVGLRTI